MIEQWILEKIDTLLGSSPIIIRDPQRMVISGARAMLVKALTTHPGAAADRLYDELVSRLVRKDQFERHSLDELLRSVACQRRIPDSHKERVKCGV